MNDEIGDIIYVSPQQHQSLIDYPASNRWLDSRCLGMAETGEAPYQNSRKIFYIFIS